MYFRTLDIKGGIAITHYDKKTEFKSIDTFTQFTELNEILQKVIGSTE